MIAVHATGDLAKINWENGEQPATISTTAVGAPGAPAPAVRADGGGSVILKASIPGDYFDAAVMTSQDYSPGLFVTGVGSSIAATDILVLTGNTTTGLTGTNSYGLWAADGGSATFTGGLIATFGESAAAVLAEVIDGPSGGSIAINGTKIFTFNDNSPGLVASGNGSSLTATDVLVKTSGKGAIGLYASGHGSSITATGALISTGGFEANGVVSADGGATNVRGGSINTTGNGAYAVVAESGVVAKSGGFVGLSGTQIGTTGDGSGGLGINGAGSEIDCRRTATRDDSGDGAIGLYAVNGGVITAATGTTATISTSGPTPSRPAQRVRRFRERRGLPDQPRRRHDHDDWTGRGGLSTPARRVRARASGGGAITVSGPLSVATGTAPCAYGAWAQGAGSTIALNGPSTFRSTAARPRSMPRTAASIDDWRHAYGASRPITVYGLTSAACGR